MWDLPILEAFRELGVYKLVLLMGIVFLAGIARGYAGFGLSALVVTTGSFFLSPVKLVPVLYLLEIVASVHMLKSVHREVDGTMLLFLLLGCALGMPIGQQLLLCLPVAGTRVALYSVVIVATAILHTGYALPLRMDRKIGFVVGILTGLASGLAAVGGMVAMVALLGVNYDVLRARATMVAMFFILYIYGTVISFLNGITTPESVEMTGLLVLPLFIGVALGQRSFLLTSRERFSRLLRGFLAVLAGAGLAQVAFTGGK